METIPFLVSLPDDGEVAKGLFSRDADVGLREVPLEALKQNMVKVCAQVGETLSQVKQVGTLKLKEVSIQVEITAEGGVELIGTAKLGGKGAITLTFE
ncbi:MAG: hypothetical protein HC800_23410 [Phormidesmis sp. RL_2_1]|nr:hypothetical protein [Phormidesmis sp. RL_2_1]